MRFDTIVPRGAALGFVRRINPYDVARMLLIAALAVQGARLVWAVATPVTPLGAWRLAEPGVDLGAAEILRGPNPFFRLDPARTDSPAAAVTAVHLTLFGTRLNGATGRGSAIIATPDGVQSSYSVGDEILPGLSLKAVAFDHVTLSRGGAEEALFLDQSGGQSGGSAQAASVSAPGPEPAPPPDAPSQRAVPGAGQGVTREEIQQGIGFIPRIDGGKVTGLSVRPQGGSDAFSRVGLKEGDIVTQIGGRPVTGPQDLERLAGTIGNGGTVSLSVERGAQIVPIAVTVKRQ